MGSAVIAYLFWHRPAESVDPAAYERRLAAFHERLRADPPAGFLGSAAFRIAAVPWFGEGYEDSYLADDWAALGVLNAAAVDSAHSPDHDAVAREAAGGAGGVYELRAGGLAVARAGTASWSGKPPGRYYPDWESDLAGDRDPADFALWRRQMVLGPAPEYCLLTPCGALTLVAGG